MSGGLTQLIQTARLLSSADSPLPPLMKRHVARDDAALAASGKNVIDKGTDKRDRRAQGRSRRDHRQGRAAPGRRRPADREHRRRPLRRPAPLRARRPKAAARRRSTTRSPCVGEVQVMLNAADAAIKSGGAPQPSPVPVKVKTEAQRLPEPARSMMDTHRRQQRAHLADDGAPEPERRGALAGRRVLPAGDRRQAIRSTATRRATRRRPTSRTVFAPGGKIDQLFQQKLATYVDTTKRPWHFRPVEGGAPLGTDIGTLTQFQRAQAIRETFFQGGNAPKLTLHDQADRDGPLAQEHHHRHRRPDRPLRPRPADPDARSSGPGPRGTDAGARHRSTRPARERPSASLYEGPWALLRLFDQVNFEPIAQFADDFRATFDVDGRKAVFEVTASSVRNPFKLPELHDFQCPMGL